MNYNIALLRGDGIGPEIVDSAVKVLLAVGEKCGHTFSFTKYLIGGAAIDAVGVPLPEETVKGCLASDSVLLGAVGGPKWDDLPGNLRPEKALLGIRSAMGLFTNLRPAKLYPALKNECPLRADIVEGGFDIMIVRELTGGIYFGERGMREGKYGEEAYDTEAYSRFEIERIARVAFETAMKEDDGKFLTASAIVAYNLQGQKQILVNKEHMAIYPYAANGKIAFSTANGEIYLMHVK